VSDSPIHVVDSTAASLGECPLWSPADAKLYWVDIEGRQVRRYDPATGVTESRSVPGRPASLALTGQPGHLVMAIENLVTRFDWDRGSVIPWLTLEPEGTGNRLNDGRTDSVGRFWVGSMYERASAGRFSGMLHRVDITGEPQTIRRGIGVTNGLGFDPARRRMYFADTLRDTVWRYQYDPGTGTMSDEAVFVDFSGYPGRPDGACVDDEGCYWVAAVYGSALLRFTPEGRLDRQIDLPVEAPSMPAFGGRDLDTLYVTSIGAGASRELAPADVEPGVLLAIETGVQGVVDSPVGTAALS
jgi:sugar lactone lactonase YvrE